MAKVWIDIDNAPHVPLFNPIASELESRGHNPLVTVRDYGYTRELIDRHGLAYTLIGRHSGKNPVMKVAGLIGRVLSLVNWARKNDIDVAISHGSRSMVLASALLRIPCISMYDYEFVSTSIFNRLSNRVLLPSLLSDERLKTLGLDLAKVRKYPGLKEEVYLGEFAPDPSILDDLEIDRDDVLIIVRPPATSAHYHNPVSEKILDRFLLRISAAEGVTAVVVPRTADQAMQISTALSAPEKFRVLTRPVDGLNLLAHADLVVGGGGTMNREAALLDVPVYSIFMGQLGAIDESLSKDGRLTLIRSVEEVDRVRLVKRQHADLSRQGQHRKQRSNELVACVCDHIIEVARM